MNDNGGKLGPEAFSFSVTEGAAVAFEADGSNSLTVDAGTYNVTEEPVAGYATTKNTCVDVVVPNGGSASCTITNDDQPGTLIVNKVVVNNNGGKLGPEAFSFSVNEGTAVAFEADGSNSLTVDAGTYSVTEPAVAGYTMTGNDCVDVVVTNGGTASCTITNDDQPGTLVVNKVVVNDNGGTLAEDDFSFQVNGGAAIGFEADGSNSLTVDAGTYSVTEPAVAGYTMTGNDCVDVVVANGGTASCTITNDDAKKSPTGDTIQSWVIRDSLILNELRAGAPDAGDAQATFTLYSGATCAAEDVVGAETVPVTGTSAVTAEGVAVFTPGEYHWRVTYTGDRYNNGFTTACSAEATVITAVDYMRNSTVGP